MSRYLSADDLLSDIRLRLDAYESEKLGVLVVEGPDDRRVFFRHVRTLTQIVPAGGRTMLLQTFGATTADDRRRMIFLVDCDYEVRRKALRPAEGLVITERTDIESDLIDLGLLHPVVGEIVPEALGSDERIAHIAHAALEESTAFALPLGRIRMAAQPLGIPLELDNFRFKNHWDRANRQVSVDKIIHTCYQRVNQDLDISYEEWKALIDGTPDDEGMCHGKDLLRALLFTLSRKYNIGRDVSVDTISRLLRASLWAQDLARWGVAARISAWERATGRRIFNRAG